MVWCDAVTAVTPDVLNERAWRGFDAWVGEGGVVKSKKKEKGRPGTARQRSSHGNEENHLEVITNVELLKIKFNVVVSSGYL